MVVLRLLDDLAERLLLRIARALYRRRRVVGLMTLGCGLILHAGWGRVSAPTSSATRPGGVAPYLERRLSEVPAVQNLLDSRVPIGELEGALGGAREQLAIALRRNRPALDRVVSLTRRPGLVLFASDIDLTILWELMDWLTARSLLGAQGHDPAGSAADALAIVRLGRASSWGSGARPRCASVVIGRLIQFYGDRLLRHLFESGRLGPDQAREVLLDLARRPRELPTLSVAVETERREAMEWLEVYARTNRIGERAGARLARLWLPWQAAARHLAARELAVRLDATYEARQLELATGWRPGDPLAVPGASCRRCRRAPGKVCRFHLVLGVLWRPCGVLNTLRVLDLSLSGLSLRGLQESLDSLDELPASLEATCARLLHAAPEERGRRRFVGGQRIRLPGR